MIANLVAIGKQVFGATIVSCVTPLSLGRHDVNITRTTQQRPFDVTRWVGFF